MLALLRQYSLFPRVGRTATFLCLLLTPVLPFHGARAEAVPAPHINGSTLQHRELYRQVREALAEGETAPYYQLRPQLEDYPLLSYVDYAYLRARLQQLSQDEVEQFLSSHADSYLGDRLEREWVSELARQQRWEDVVRYHRSSNTTVVLSCQALQARLETGDTTALSEVPRLWNVGRSQPNECDPVFDVWMEQGLLTSDIAWDRFGKTLRAGQRGLARYIAGLMSPQQKELADVYLLIDSQPERLKDHSALSNRAPEITEIIFHGVRRLASIDAPQAMMMLHSHNQRHGFDENDVLTLQRFIAMRLLLQGFVSETESLLRNSPELVTETLVSWLLRDAMREQNWQRIETWLDKLPEDAQQSERWTYWRARMLAHKGTGPARAEAQALYRSLAASRSYYGFLSADLAGLDYELLDRPVPSNGEQMLALYDEPAIVRAYELFKSGDEVNARFEWQYGTRTMNPDQIISSGQLADSWGWHRNSIQAMIQAGYWDDLQLRFPLAYTELFSAAATEHAVQPHLLFAVARQESAFMHDVRSPSGARGLMQLMPGTGRQTANGMGMNITDQDLYVPEVNIMLGSRYMAELLQEFNGNRAVAAAAYNAGPNRVRQWLRRTQDAPIPLDMWIETIPFAETRGYVQNVLAYSVIYSYRMGDLIAFLTDEEAGSLL